VRERRCTIHIQVPPYLKIRDQLLQNSLPSDKAFDEDIRRPQVVWCDVFLDQRLISRDGGAVLARP
jgi:hypothetical protein